MNTTQRAGLVVCLLGPAGGGGGCVTMDSSAIADLDFDRHELSLADAERSTVVTGFLLGDDVANLAVLTVDDDGARRVRIDALDDGGWVPRVDAALRPEVSFVDVATIAGRDRLIAYGGGRLTWFDSDAGREVELVSVVSDFDPPGRAGIPHVDITHDVNDDDRDDLLVPQTDGVSVFVQTDGGGFADPVTLVLPPGLDRSFAGDGYRSDPWGSGRVHAADCDRDGRSDLVYWNGNHFAVHRQDDRGRFDPAPRTMTTDITFDSDELATLAAPLEIHERRMDHELTRDLTGRVLHDITDMNGDGVADLVIFTLEGGSLWKMSTTYEVYYGAPGPPGADGGIVFGSEAGAVIRRKGIAFGMSRHDFEADGQSDLIFVTIKPSLLKVAGLLLEAFFTGSVSMELAFHRMEDGRYATKPHGSRTIRSEVAGASGTRALHPAVLVGDVSGDGRAELLVQRGRRKLQIFAGVPGPEVFARRPQTLAVDMPKDEEYTWLVDLNRDGKQDVLMHHASATEPDRVTTLIAR
ncbi:MAG: hypothetical protein HKN62_09710 [Phycisphaerales bacterium]|nr:hypothetical protein [Phycisphaerales bacterium]